MDARQRLRRVGKRVRLRRRRCRTVRSGGRGGGGGGSAAREADEDVEEVGGVLGQVHDRLVEGLGAVDKREDEIPAENGRQARQARRGDHMRRARSQARAATEGGQGADASRQGTGREHEVVQVHGGHHDPWWWRPGHLTDREYPRCTNHGLKGNILTWRPCCTCARPPRTCCCARSPPGTGTRQGSSRSHAPPPEANPRTETHF